MEPRVSVTCFRYHINLVRYVRGYEQRTQREIIYSVSKCGNVSRFFITVATLHPFKYMLLFSCIPAEQYEIKTTEFRLCPFWVDLITINGGVQCGAAVGSFLNAKNIVHSIAVNGSTQNGQSNHVFRKTARRSYSKQRGSESFATRVNDHNRNEASAEIKSTERLPPPKRDFCELLSPFVCTGSQSMPVLKLFYVFVFPAFAQNHQNTDPGVRPSSPMATPLAVRCHKSHKKHRDTSIS